MAQSVITQVTRDADSYTPCPPPVSIQERGTANNARNSERSTKPDKLCICNWLLACFKKDEPAVGSAPFSNDSSSSPPTPEFFLTPQLGAEKYLLPPRERGNESRKCVIIDLDETLVHSSFKPVANADFIVPVEIDNVVHQVYVLKRPFCDEFLKRMGEMFECVLFTASLAKYADPVANLLDKYSTFSTRLFRESCVFHRGNYVKDLSRLGRDLSKVVIIDNSPQSYIFHPNNAVPVTTWFDDPNDTELLELIPFFEALDKEEDVVTALSRYHQFQNTPIPMDIQRPLTAT